MTSHCKLNTLAEETEIVDLSNKVRCLKTEEKFEFLNNLTISTLITTISLTDCDLTPDYGLAISQIVSQLNCLLVLKISKNPLEDTSVANIINELTKKSPSLTEFHFERCHLTSNISKSICRNIGTFKNLKVLRFGGNLFGNEIIKLMFEEIVSCSQLKEIACWRCGFSDYIFKDICSEIEKLKNLEIIDFGQNSLGKIQQYSSRTRYMMNDRINSIMVSQCNLRFEYGFFLKNYSNLRNLSISQNPIGDIYGNQIFEELEKTCHSLIALYCYKCQFTQKIGKNLVNFLAKQKNLIQVNFSSNSIGNKVGKDIFTTLEKFNENLQEIECWKCDFNSELGETISEFIQNQKNLTVIKLNNNPFGDEAMKLILESIIKNCTNLRKFSIACCSLTQKIGEQLGDAIGKQSQLVELSIAKNDLGNRVGKRLFYKILKYCENIKEIYCFQCNFTSDDEIYIDEAIGNLKDLSCLNISDNRFGDIIGKKIFSSITKNCRVLKELSIRNCGLTHKSITHIASAISNQLLLSHLNISKNSFGNEILTIFQHIYQNSHNLTKLNFQQCNITKDINDDFINGIQKQRYLTSLKFDYNDLGNDIGKKIFSAISTNCCHLTEITCSNCSFDENVSLSMADAIKAQANLKIFDCSCNCLKDKGGENIFRAILNSSPTLQILSANVCEFSQGISFLVYSAIKKQVNLNKFEIENNNFNTKTKQEFFRAINQNSIQG